MVGIIAGVIIVHPYVMLVNLLTGPQPWIGPTNDIGTGGLLKIFIPDMLPMTIAFTFFGGVCGFLLGLVFERNERLNRYGYKIRLHSDLTTALHQLLGVVSHYILNGSLIISAHARRLEKTTTQEDQLHLAAIINQAEKNESVLKLLQETAFLQNIDPSDRTYKKLIELNQRIEQQLREQRR